jgi:enoyl-CoA hydratase/carnithine racemase
MTDMSNRPSLYEERGPWPSATLNRPQALNSFTRQMHRELWRRAGPRGGQSSAFVRS